MSSFTEKSSAERLKGIPEVSKLLGSEHLIVDESFEYHVNSKGSDEVIRVPKGFTVDTKTKLPNLFKKIKQYGDRTALASVIHAYLYESKTVLLKGIPIPVDKKYSDSVFIEALKVAGISGYRLLFIRMTLLFYRLFMDDMSNKKIAGKQAVETTLRQNADTSNGHMYLTKEQSENLLNNYPTLKGEKNG